MIEILIGRDEKTSRLAIVYNGKGYIVDVQDVPLSVSRCKPKEKKGHCSLIIGTSGKMKIQNLVSENVTYVNGEAVDVQNVDENSIVELGYDQYRISVKKILKVIGYERPYSIKHLKRVWEKYDKAMLKLQIEQQKKQNQQKLQGILSQLSMLCVIIPSVIPSIPIPVALRVVLVVGALGLGIYFYIKGGKVDDSFVMKKRELEENFRDDYVCPKCGSFMGNRPYEDIEGQKQCSKCQCKYVS
ncbi:MAG: FHA domain-containing protein [Prevotella sp.]|nr:FHA domain-containing protein [Prevotella sp.]